MYSLEEAARVARIIQEQGGGKLDSDTIAVGLDLSPKGSPFQTRISSAKHYGLIDKEGNIFVTTTLAKKILLPTSPEEKQQALIDSFLNFSVFKELCDRYKNAKLPDESILENILVRSHGISDSSKKSVYNIFIESGKFAGKIIDTDDGLYCGEVEVEIVEKNNMLNAQKPVIDKKMVELLKHIGSIKTLLTLHSMLDKDTKLKTEEILVDLLEKSLNYSTDLGLSALKMSLKITRDRLISTKFLGAETFIRYLEEGLYEDLKLEKDDQNV
jgi:hypothetical protein